MTLQSPINDELAAWDRDGLLHPTTHTAQHARGDVPGRIITGGDGCTIIDRDGNRFLNGFAALYCVNAGYGRTEIADAMNEQAQKLAFFHAFAGHGNEPAIRLARMIMDRAPDHMARVYFGLSGSDANETNVKLIWQYNNLLGRPEKRKVISRWRAYHGSGLVSGSLTGLAAYHARFNLPLDGFLHTHTPHFLRRPDTDMTEADFTDFLITELEAMIEAEGPDTIAAFIGEPIMGTGGILPPPCGLLGRRATGSGAPRHRADRRRGCDRLWPTGVDVRVRSLRPEARFHDHRQGADIRLRAAVRLHHLATHF